MRFQITRSSEGAVCRKAPCVQAIRGPESAAFPGQYQWFVELSDLAELLALLRETGGGLGLFSPEEGEPHPVIEIFDDTDDE